MGKRKDNSEEAIGPVLDGLSSLAEMIPAISNDTQLEELAEDLPAPLEDGLEQNEDDFESAVLLIFGEGADAAALGTLATNCGFDVRHAVARHQEEQEMDSQRDASLLVLEDLANLVEDCNIERNFFICIFTEDASDCELILSQCLASDASYIGMAGQPDKISEVFEALRSDGAPDAELAAIAAPLGLNIGAANPEQKAVAIVAEMLAAKAGKLKRLRQGSRKPVAERS